MSPSVISGNKIQIKNFRMFLVIYFELRQYWLNWRKLNRSEVEERQVWLIPYEPYVMTHTVWRNLTETAGTNNLAVVSAAAGSTFRTSFWSSTVFTGTYIFTDTAKISSDFLAQDKYGYKNAIVESTNQRPVEKKLVIMINHILLSKFHFQKWWSGFCFRKTRSVTFPKFQRKKLWPGTQYFCLDFVSVNHTRWRSQIRILKIFLDFVSVKHGGWFPNFWILFPWFANKG